MQEPKCRLDSPDCVYHPDLEVNKKVFADNNLEVTRAYHLNIDTNYLYGR